MLEQKDLQSIGELLDKKLDERFNVQEGKITQKFDEMVGIVNDGFTEMQKGFDGLKEEFNGVKGGLSGIKEDIKLRPTLNQIMSWGDKKIVELELRADRHDFMHIDKLDKLPPPAEINRSLIERGFKVKEAKI